MVRVAGRQSAAPHCCTSQHPLLHLAASCAVCLGHCRPHLKGPLLNLAGPLLCLLAPSAKAILAPSGGAACHPVVLLPRGGAACRPMPALAEPSQKKKSGPVLLVTTAVDAGNLRGNGGDEDLRGVSDEGWALRAPVSSKPACGRIRRVGVPKIHPIPCTIPSGLANLQPCRPSPEILPSRAGSCCFWCFRRKRPFSVYCVHCTSKPIGRLRSQLSDLLRTI